MCFKWGETLYRGEFFRPMYIAGMNAVKVTNLVKILYFTVILPYEFLYTDFSKMLNLERVSQTGLGLNYS